jgi:hypothetical protein
MLYFQRDCKRILTYYNKFFSYREPLCRSMGVKGTFTMFTGPASQKLAASCGFVPIFQASYIELANLGYKVPINDNVINVMAKKYD